MNTLRELAWVIIDELSAGKPDNEIPWDERVVMLRLRMQIQELAKVQRLELRAEGERELPSLFIYTYNDRQVTKPLNAKYATVAIPDFYMALPYNKGLYQVCPNNDAHEPYIRRRNQDVTRRLKVGDLQGKVGWWTEGTNIFMSPVSKVPSKVIVKLILPAPAAIGPNDPLPITPEMQSQLIRLVKSDIQNMGIQDVHNDGNSVVTNEQK